MRICMYVNQLRCVHFPSLYLAIQFAIRVVFILHDFVRLSFRLPSVIKCLLKRKSNSQDKTDNKKRPVSFCLNSAKQLTGVGGCNLWSKQNC